MPISKPEFCSLSSWLELKKVFVGVECPQILGGEGHRPEYLDVPGHLDCLGKQAAVGGTHQELCLLTEKRPECVQEAFDKLQEVFKGDQCRDQSVVPVKIKADALPPAYLFVKNHEKCLGVERQSEGHLGKCLPPKRPSNCPEVSSKKIGAVA